MSYQLVGGRALGDGGARSSRQPGKILQHRAADLLQLGARVAVAHVADHDAQLVRVQPVVRVVQRRQGQPAVQGTMMTHHTTPNNPATSVSGAVHNQTHSTQQFRT